MRVTKGDIKAASHGAVWCEHNGTLYGDYNGTVVKSNDGWLSIERVVDLGKWIGCIYVTSNGTLIVGTRETMGEVFRVTPDGKAELVLTHKHSIYSRSWSINGHGDKVVVGAYGQKNAPNPEDNGREVYYSDDDGKTFDKIFETPALAGTHVHAVAIDAITNNVWVSNGDQPTSCIRLLEYPNWTPIVIKELYQPTAIIAKHERYVLFGTDFELPHNGVVRYDRDTEELIQVFQFPAGFNRPVYSAFYDTETKTAYFGTAQTGMDGASSSLTSLICKSQPPFTDWEIIVEDETEKYSVVKAITRLGEGLYFARDEGTYTIPEIDTRKYYIKEPYRKP